MNFLFTIIIPSHNRADFLSQSIESVSNQSYSDWELIVVDDGSTDNTKEVVQSYNDERIQYIYQENAERSVARNNGISKAKGEYICFLDSDDKYLENHLKVLKEHIEKENAQFLVTGCRVGIDNDHYTCIPDKPSWMTDSEYLLDQPIAPQRTCIHKSILKKEKFLDGADIIPSEDTELWLRIAKNHEVTWVKKDTILINEHEERSTNTNIIPNSNSRLNVIKLSSHDHPYVSKKMKNRILGNLYQKRAQHYMLVNEKMKFLRALVVSVYYGEGHRLKERLTLLLKYRKVRREFLS